MSRQTLAPVGSPVFPRIDLLPPEIEQERRLRKLQGGLAGVAVLALGVVGLLHLQAAGQVDDAQTRLEVVQAQSRSLQSDATAYDAVPAVYAQVAQARARDEQAMGGEVRWSFYLADLARTMPSKVWLSKVEVSSVAPTVPGALGSPVVPGIATVAVSGRGYTHNDVATWLERLAAMKGQADATFAKSATTDLNGRTVVDFESSATITAARLSGRYLTKAGD